MEAAAMNPVQHSPFPITFPCNMPPEDRLYKYLNTEMYITIQISKPNLIANGSLKLKRDFQALDLRSMAPNQISVCVDVCVCVCVPCVTAWFKAFLLRASLGASQSCVIPLC